MGRENSGGETMNEAKSFVHDKVDVIEYLHKCLCGWFWYSEMKISHCPKCRRQHIWFNGTSRIKD